MSDEPPPPDITCEAPKYSTNEKTDILAEFEEGALRTLKFGEDGDENETRSEWTAVRSEDHASS